MDITVIVPCYNSERTLSKCLDSLIAQSMKVMVFVINDGSTDRTAEIAECYARDHSNIRFFSHANKGLPQSRKAGLDRVTTKYTAFVDSDDWVEPNMFFTLYQISESFGAEVSACELFYDSGNRTQNKGKKRNTYCMDGIHALSCIQKRTGVFQYMCNKLFLTEFLRAFSFPKENLIGEDYTTLLSNIENAKCVVMTNSMLYHYVQHAGNMTKKGFDALFRKSFENYRNLFQKFSDNHSSRQMQEMADYLCLEYLGIYVSMVRNSNYDSEVENYIRDFLKKHEKTFLKEKVPVQYILSAIMIPRTPVIFRLLYRLYYFIWRLSLQISDKL